jgi:hypothetical protein
LPATVPVIFYLAYALGLVPVLWLAGLRARGRKVDPAFWWLAGAFGVSFVADSIDRFVTADPRWLVSLAYPVSQAAFVGVVFLSRIEAAQFIVALMIVALADLLSFGVGPVPLLLPTVAWLGVSGLVVDRWALGTLRTALLVSFGLGTLTWWGYAAWPGMNSWLLYQIVRAAGIALFCVAASNPTPKFRLARRE